MRTLMFSSLLKPSSWFNNSSIVRCTSRSPLVSESNRFVPIASISSAQQKPHGRARSSAAFRHCNEAPQYIIDTRKCLPGTYEDDGRSFLLCQGKGIAHELCPIANEHLHKLWTGQLKERGISLCCAGSGQKRLSRARRPVQ